MKIDSDYFGKVSPIFFIGLLAILIIVWPFPGTIAIRQITMALAASIGLLMTYRELKFDLVVKPIFFLGAFFLWVVIHYFFYAQNQTFEYAQLLSSWVRIFVSTILGLTLAIYLRHKVQSSLNRLHFWFLVLLIFLSMPFLVIYFNWGELMLMKKVTDTAEFWRKPYGDKHSIVFYGVIFIGGFFGVIQFFSWKKNKIYMCVAFGVIFIYLSIFFLANTKNGFGVFLFQLLSFCIVFIFARKINGKIIVGAMLISAIVVPIIFKHLDRNSSWKQLIPDIQIGYQIDSYPHWQRYDYGYPLNKNAQEVSPTNYERAAWGTAGLRLLLENPMGYGLIKQSFGHMAQIKWPNIDPVKVKSTHSGWIDFALAYGIPGITLVFLSIFFSLNAAWRNRGDFWGVLTLWVLPTTVFVWLVAELCTNHFVEMLFMILGFFALINNKSKNGCC